MGTFTSLTDGVEGIDSTLTGIKKSDIDALFWSKYRTKKSFR